MLTSSVANYIDQSLPTAPTAKLGSMMLVSFKYRPCCCFRSHSCSSVNRIAPFFCSRLNTHNPSGKQRNLSPPHSRTLQVSKRYEVPGMPNAESDYLFRYRVKEGDTLTSIAMKFRTSVQSIASSNYIVDIDYVPAGKILLIPSEPLKQAQKKGELTASIVSTKPVQPTDLLVQEVVPTTTFLKPVITKNAFAIVASVLLVLLAAFHLGKRHMSSTIANVHGGQVEEVQLSAYRPRRRWKGILDDDRKVDEVEERVSQEGQTEEELEEEKLRESYAELETRYLKFLEESGLSTSGYWRGGVSGPSDED